MIEDIIYELVNENIKCQFLDVKGDGRHFDMVAVSDEFFNKSKIQRHRLVYSVLGDKMKEEVHALSMKLYTVNEWNEKNG